MAKDEYELDQSHGGAQPRVEEPPSDDPEARSSVNVALLPNPGLPRPVTSDAALEGYDGIAEIWEDSLLRSSLVTARLGAAADNATFAVAERATGHAVVVASAREGTRDLWRSRFRPGDGVAGRVLETRQPLLLEETRHSPTFRPIGSHPVRSIVAVPVEMDGRTLGVLSLTSARPRGFSPASAAYLQAVAVQVAQVIERAARSAYLERLRDLAHDLNTPLNAVHGFLKLVLDSEDPRTRQQQELLDLAATAADQLIRLVGDMHDSMYLSSGKLALHLSPVDPVDLARTAVAGCAPLAAESGLRLACVWRPNMPTIRADRRRVERILGNLLQNAMKFAPPGTEIQVGVELDGTQAIRFTVDDEGPGFDEREIGRLFAPSFQGKGSGARMQGGHGLGLSIAHALAAAHGGRMVAANRAGGGAHFALVLPLDPATAPGRD